MCDFYVPDIILSSGDTTTKKLYSNLTELRISWRTQKLNWPLILKGRQRELLGGAANWAWRSGKVRNR